MNAHAYQLAGPRRVRGCAGASAAGRLAACSAGVVACLLHAAVGTAQVPGTPLSTVRNASALREPLPSVSLESGVYRHRVGWVAPLAMRWAIDIGGFGISAGYGSLVALDANGYNGFGVGLGAGLDLWPSGDSYGAFGGRVFTGAGYSRFDRFRGAVRQLDLPLTLALVHKLPPPGFTILPWIAPRAQARVVDDGRDSDVRWLAGGSLGLEIVRSVCPPGRECVWGWGARIGFELIDDVDRGPREGGITLGLLWKLF